MPRDRREKGEVTITEKIIPNGIRTTVQLTNRPHHSSTEIESHAQRTHRGVTESKCLRVKISDHETRVTTGNSTKAIKDEPRSSPPPRRHRFVEAPSRKRLDYNPPTERHTPPSRAVLGVPFGDRRQVALGSISDTRSRSQPVSSRGGEGSYVRERPSPPPPPNDIATDLAHRQARFSAQHGGPYPYRGTQSRYGSQPSGGGFVEPEDGGHDDRTFGARRPDYRPQYGSRRFDGR